MPANPWDKYRKARKKAVRKVKATKNKAGATTGSPGYKRRKSKSTGGAKAKARHRSLQKNVKGAQTASPGYKRRKVTKKGTVKRKTVTRKSPSASSIRGEKKSMRKKRRARVRKKITPVRRRVRKNKPAITPVKKRVRKNKPATTPVKRRKNKPTTKKKKK